MRNMAMLNLATVSMCPKISGPPKSCLQKKQLTLTPRKLTWQWNITIFNRRYIFLNGCVFHCHSFVFRGCKLFFVWQTNPRWKFFRPQLSATPENDGSFYMPWEDFATIYDTITICPVLWRQPKFLRKLKQMCSFNNQTPKCVVMPSYPTPK